MNAIPGQAPLFDAPNDFPNGLVYRPDFLSPDEEAVALAELARLPFHEAKFKEYTARRRVVSFGAAYDDEEREANIGVDFPPFVLALREKVAAWLNLSASAFVHVLASEYKAGTPIGWHRDRGDYGIVVGVSLAGWCRMRFRPLSARQDPRRQFVLDLQPRSAYVMRGAIRWQWQHSIAPTKMLRYSITFRTLV